MSAEEMVRYAREHGLRLLEIRSKDGKIAPRAQPGRTCPEPLARLQRQVARTPDRLGGRLGASQRLRDLIAHVV